MRVRFTVFVMMSRLGLCNGHDEPTVLNTFQANQAASECLDPSRFAMDDEDLQAGIMIEVRMAGRDHQFVVCVLKCGQLLANAVGVMVVDERDGANYRRIGIRRPFGDEPIADEIAEGLRAVRITESGDEIIEAIEEIRIERNADSAENAHGHSLEEN